jgi:23S rRNA pseudouridine955/2504/2580 synthase
LLIDGVNKDAILRYKITQIVSDLAFVDVELLTGLTHQIRRQLADIGLPIVGDDKYGDFSVNKRFRRSVQNGGLGIKRLLLHAQRLVIDGQLDVVSPLPPEWERLSLVAYT